MIQDGMAGNVLAKIVALRSKINVPCSIPPPILKYQHFASNGPYAPRACKPKSIATYYKIALQILHTSQNLLLGILPPCQLAEQRLGLNKEICKRISGYAHTGMEGR